MSIIGILSICISIELILERYAVWVIVSCGDVRYNFIGHFFRSTGSTTKVFACFSLYKFVVHVYFAYIVYEQPHIIWVYLYVYIFTSSNLTSYFLYAWNSLYFSASLNDELADVVSNVRRRLILFSVIFNKFSLTEISLMFSIIIPNVEYQ